MHDQARRVEDTDWREIAALYGLLERLTGNPMVSLNRAIAIAEYETAAKRTNSVPENHYLTMRAARINQRRNEGRPAPGG